MAIVDKNTLKGNFQTGDTPTQANFEDFIDSTYGNYPVDPVALTYGASITPNLNDGLLRTTTLTGNVELNAPTNPVSGGLWTWYITSDATPRNLTLNAAIKIPSDSAFTSPKTLDASKTYVLQLRYIGTSWCLTSLVGGY